MNLLGGARVRWPQVETILVPMLAEAGSCGFGFCISFGIRLWLLDGVVWNIRVRIYKSLKNCSRLYGALTVALAWIGPGETHLRQHAEDDAIGQPAMD